MKKLFATTLILAAGSSFAADRAIYDVMYLPTAKTTYGLSDISVSSVQSKAGSYEADAVGIGFTQGIGHSFSDRFSLQAGIAYTTATNDPDEGDKTTSRGVNDPTLAARFRAMEDLLILDIIGAATIGLGDAKQEKDGDTNNLQGGNDFSLGAQLGQKFSSVQWAATLNYTRSMKATTDVAGSGKDVKDDAYNTWELTGEALNKFSEKSLLRSRIGVSFADKYDNNNDSSTASSTTYALGAEYQHLISADLLGRAGVTMFSSNSDTGNVDYVVGQILNVGATYQF